MGSSSVVQSGSDGYLNLVGALKAVQALSSEMVLTRLLDTLITIMIECAGAQRGYLFLPKQAQWVISATANKEPPTDAPRALDQIPAPMSIVNHVAHTHKAVLIDDSTAENPFAHDPYLQGTRPRSVLCLPMLHQDDVVGIIYMENDLAAGVFQPQRLELLSLLATQAAISLRNASLVTELKRTEEMAQANELRFRHLFENVPLCIFEIDVTEDTPIIRAANRRAEAVYGWPEAEFTTLKPEQLVPAESRSEVRRMIEAVRDGETVIIETTNIRRDGAVFPVRIIATPERGPHENHLVVAVEDITAERERRSEAEAIDEERRRIAQEIHDGIAQDLAALRLKISLWHDWVDTHPEQMHIELDGLKETLDNGIEEIRRSISALRPVALDEVGLFQAVRQYVADYNNQYPISVDLKIDIAEERLPAELELPLFRIVQEALNNIAKHSQASLVRITFDLTDGDKIVLSIRDNGRGFDLTDLENAMRAGHWGLKQMRERVEKVGGTLLVESEAARGTRVRATVPIA